MAQALDLRNVSERRMEAAFQRELEELFARNRALSKPHNPLVAMEGLVTATLLSTAAWSLLAMLVFRRP
jgi:hypothetical protein